MTEYLKNAKNKGIISSCVLFKEFGGVDAFPLCVRSKSVDEIVRTVELLAGSFRGVNLEDISAPRCFEIERKLKETIVSSLDLEDLAPEGIESDMPLFGEGLGLDSIDALELGMAVKKAFGVAFASDPAENRKILFITDDPEKFAQFQKTQSELSAGIGRLLALSENYPSLKSNENFLDLQSQLEGLENRITSAICSNDINEMKK